LSPTRPEPDAGSPPPSFSDAAGAAGGDSGILTLAGRIRTRTLTLIRWVAIGGQLAALVVADTWFAVDIPLLPVSLLISLSVVVNLACVFVYRRRAWLPEGPAAALLGFDLLQLSGLLALTGGIANPFAVLILAPVTVSASVLSARSTAALAALAVILETLLAIWHRPLPWFGGGIVFDPLLLGGIWCGLVLATLFMAGYIGSLAAERRGLGEALATTELALAREQRLTALGGLAAAVAHELGSPLNTILLVSRELAREMPANEPWRADIDLLVEESERCRKLLSELSQRSEEADAEADDPFRRVPASTLVELAAEPFQHEGASLEIRKAGSGPEPSLPHDPALLHGLGTLLQNALQFATAKVVASLRWDERELRLSIVDDGPGFAPDVLSRLGEPYVAAASVSPRAGDRSEESHMGLGVFIAQTLLGRSGARLAFGNVPQGGAEVAISWPINHFVRGENRT
jgi:two-component system sensor histidine kinase RegB